MCMAMRSASSSGRSTGYAIRITSVAQRATAQNHDLDVVWHRTGQLPRRIDHEELAVVRARLDARTRGPRSRAPLTLL